MLNNVVGLMCLSRLLKVRKKVIILVFSMIVVMWFIVLVFIQMINVISSVKLKFVVCVGIFSDSLLKVWWRIELFVEIQVQVRIQSIKVIDILFIRFQFLLSRFLVMVLKLELMWQLRLVLRIIKLECSMQNQVKISVVSDQKNYVLDIIIGSENMFVLIIVLLIIIMLLNRDGWVVVVVSVVIY